jgi:hypothetical protein
LRGNHTTKEDDMREVFIEGQVEREVYKSRKELADKQAFVGVAYLGGKYFLEGDGTLARSPRFVVEFSDYSSNYEYFVFYSKNELLDWMKDE